MKKLSIVLLLLASFTATGGTITINGKTYSGDNVIVNNSNVNVDGNNVYVGDTHEINIKVIGNIDSLKVASCNSCVVNGSVGSFESTSGNVHVGDVSGNVKTVSGNVYANQISGSVHTVSGNVGQ